MSCGAAGYFPRHQLFAQPDALLSHEQSNELVAAHFPALSEERSELLVCFSIGGSAEKEVLYVTDITEARFLSSLRQEAAKRRPIGQIISAYSISVESPASDLDWWQPLVEVYDHRLRHHIAQTILHSWFGVEISVTNHFIEQVRLCFQHQQSPQPHLLVPISEEMPWAHIVAYNAGLRDFEELPKVLALQDIKEVIGKIREETKAQLKAFAAKTGTTFNVTIHPCSNYSARGVKFSKN